MKKIFLQAFFTFMLIILSAKAQAQKSGFKCPPNYIWNNGCLKLCSHPDFQNCGDVFPTIFNPNFCALSKTGRWNSQTFTCAACKRPDVIGVKDGKCSCEQEGCKQGYECKNGRCELIQSSPVLPRPISPGNCPSVTCLTGFKCIYGKCIPGPGYCNENRDCESLQFCLQNKCIERCTTINCPDGDCIKGQCVPRIKKCRKNYECPAGFICSQRGLCVDKCQGIICIATSRCIDGACVPLCENIKCNPGYYCYNLKCIPIPGYCYTQKQCNGNQICYLNQCVQFCKISSCPAGTNCVGNKCVIKKQCSFKQKCPYGQRCIKGLCVDSCDRILCPLNTKCFEGRCITNDSYCYSDEQCKDGNKCVQGKCINNCQLILCAPGFICSNATGTCVQVSQCYYDNQCSYDKKCLNNHCIDRCYQIVCPYGQVCKGGRCIAANPCVTISCMPGSRCQNGKCIPIYPTCYRDQDCKKDQFCYGNQCIDKCKTIKCSNGFICEYGKCIPLCSKLVCPIGFKCIQGKCQLERGFCRKDEDCKKDYLCFRGFCVNKCSKINCPKGSYCMEGQCRLDLNVCPNETDYTPFKCTDPRPIINTCPVLNYIVQPAANYCGVTIRGERIPFVRPCQACLNTTIDYYFNAPCYEVPFVCEENQKCLGYYCSSTGCKKNEQCTYDWQNCFAGQCLDICTFLKCADCKYGKCGYVQPYGYCRFDLDCADPSWSCVDWKCADLCWNVKCPFNHKCQKGVCKPKWIPKGGK